MVSYYLNEVSFLNNKLSTRALTEGALMAGLATIFALLGMVPIIGAFTILISGIPISIVTARHGSFSGGLSALLATLLIALLLGPFSALSYGLENMLLGFVIGYMLNQRKNGMKILQASVLTAGVAALLLTIVSFAIMGFTPDTISAYYAQMETEMMKMYETSGMLDALLAQDGVNATELMAMLQGMIATVVKISPATVTIMGGFTGAITFWLTMLILKRLKVRIPRTTQITQWKLPFGAIWPIIVIWTVWLMGSRIPFAWVNVLALNGIVICAVLLFLNGLTAAIQVFRFKEMSTIMKLLTVIMLVMCFTAVLIGLIIFGIADLLFDFRNKKVDNR